MLVMAVIVHVLVGVFHRFMAVLMAIVGVGHGLVFVLMFMFIFAMAAHSAHLLS